VRGEHALNQIEGLLAAAGDENIVVLARGTSFAGLIQQVTPQRSIPTGRTELQNRRGVLRVDHFAARDAKFVERKHDFGGPRRRKTDGRRDGSFHSWRQSGPIEASIFFRRTFDTTAP